MSFIDSKSFGVIVYMEPKEYSNNVSENIEIHIPISKESIVFDEEFLLIFTEIKDAIIKELGQKH